MDARDPVTLEPPRLEHLCDLLVTVAAPIEAGDGPFGLRRVIPITGGVVRGPGMSGRVLDAGADFQVVVGGTTAHLDARYLIELDDGARIFVHNTALRHASAATTAKLLRGEPVPPAGVYFRCQPRFETASAALGWINDRLFVGTGVRHPQTVAMRFFALD